MRWRDGQIEKQNRSGEVAEKQPESDIEIERQREKKRYRCTDISYRMITAMSYSREIKINR